MATVGSPNADLERLTVFALRKLVSAHRMPPNLYGPDFRFYGGCVACFSAAAVANAALQRPQRALIVACGKHAGKQQVRWKTRDSRSADENAVHVLFSFLIEGDMMIVQYSAVQ